MDGLTELLRTRRTAAFPIWSEELQILDAKRLFGKLQAPHGSATNAILRGVQHSIRGPGYCTGQGVYAQNSVASLQSRFSAFFTPFSIGRVTRD